MNGIIFNTEQEFTIWNVSVTNEMLAQGQIMSIWCNPIISRDGNNKYFGSTNTIGIRRTIIEQFIVGHEEVEILPTDEVWFDQTPIPFPTTEA